MGKMIDKLCDLQADFEYYTSDIENLKNKPHLKAAIATHMNCGNDYGIQVNRDYVDFVFANCE